LAAINSLDRESAMPSPTSSSSVVSVNLTGSQTIDALLYGARWESSTITYSFPGVGSIWSTSTTTGYGPSTGGKEPWSSSFSPLSTSGQLAFMSALQKWSNVANLQFSQVADTSTIVGDIRAAYTYQNDHPNDQSWAYLPADAASAGDIWFNVIGASAGNSWTPGSRAYFAALHELGHVLGLKHPFEGPTTLPPSLDSESYTVMSYSAQPGNSSTQFNFNPTTPMLLDIAAIQQLYGANYSYHSGNDIYSYSDAARYHETIWDGGGSDTIQYTGSGNSTIDLREGHGSRIGPAVYVQSAGSTLYEVDNVWIADGAVIENGIGGSGNDALTGNAGENALTGGAGNDTIDGGGGIDTSAYSSTIASYSIAKTGNYWTVAGGSDGTDTMLNVERLQFSDALRYLGPASTDVDGDGKSDILWRNSATGQSALWDNGNSASGHFLTTVADPTWKMAGVGDFGGDGKSDVLWRNTATGQNAVWDNGDSATGRFLITVADLNWKVVGTGDFAGDGKSDILWRNTATGADYMWDDGNGASGHSLTTVADQNWNVVGIGDFAGDGKSDILWRHAATGGIYLWNDGNGAAGHALTTVADFNWKVVGIGDLAGDGKSDILWRNTATGEISLWDNGNADSRHSLGTVADQNWKIAEIGDFVNDGKADILWRNTATGQNAMWDNGDSAAGHFLTTVADLNWHITSQINALLTGDGLYLA
jgi:hypothetical protein